MGKTSWMPDRKVWSGGVTTILGWFIAYTLAKYGYPLDPQIAAMLPPMLGYLVSYFMPASVRDIITKLDNDLVAAAQADPNIPVTVPVVTQAEAVPVVVGKQDPGQGVKPPNPAGVTLKSHAWLALPLAATLILPLMGCNSPTLQKLEAAANAGYTIATATVKNPVTLTMVYDLRAAHVAAQRVALAYRRIGLCPPGVAATVGAPCADRAVVTNIIAADKASRKAVDALEAYVRTHPTLDATDLYTAAKMAVTRLQGATPAA